MLGGDKVDVQGTRALEECEFRLLEDVGGCGGGVVNIGIEMEEYMVSLEREVVYFVLTGDDRLGRRLVRG